MSKTFSPKNLVNSKKAKTEQCKKKREREEKGGGGCKGEGGGLGNRSLLKLILFY